MAEVQLFGNWACPFTRRIELALKIKGVKYEYIEEDLCKKSDCLLQHNPIYQRVPVLVHKGKAICESLIILEYIDETWHPHHHLLPKEPCLKARARFWAKFIEEKIHATSLKIETAIEVEKLKLKAEFYEHLKFLECELKEKGHQFFGGLEMGFLDIVAFFTFHWLHVRQEAFEVDFLTEHNYPCLCNWMAKLRSHDVVHRCLPPKEKHIAFFKARFEALEFPSK